MNALSEISLDTDWTCIYSDGTSHLAEMKPERVSSLLRWSPLIPDEGVSAVLMHSFDLHPTDVCVRYLLHIDSAPGTIKFDINQRQGVEVDGTRPFVLDVTDHVRLERNFMNFTVQCGAEGAFGEVFLQQIPCE